MFKTVASKPCMDTLGRTLCALFDLGAMSESPTGKTCWVLSEGHAGMENQCIGLAERVGLPFRVLRVRPRRPWTWLPPAWWPAPRAALGPDSDPIEPPWPDLLITCGRRSVPFALLIGRESGGRTFTVHIQDPQTRPDRFDLLVPPRHDHISAANAIATTGALHRVTAERLAQETVRVAPDLAHLPRPLVTVLIGGSNSCYRMRAADVVALADQLISLCQHDGVGLAISPSRRTGAENLAVLRERLSDAPAVIWDFQGDNPYFGYLGLADLVVVTCDSVSMVSEAAATGKPVHVVHLAGGNAKFREFHRHMNDAGYTRPFQGRLERWTYPPLDDTATVAAEIVKRMPTASVG